MRNLYLKKIKSGYTTKECLNKTVKLVFPMALHVYDKFKKHMEDILYEREKALMPATQPLIENKIRMNKMKDELQEIRNQIKNLEDIKRRLEINIDRVRRNVQPIDFLGEENYTDNSVNTVKNNTNNCLFL